MRQGFQDHDEPGARAIEVAAMLGDSIVDVKHCMDPRGGKVTRRTWTTLGVGAALIVSSIVAFAISVHTAAQNARAFTEWTHVLKKPAGAFRAELAGAGLDWLAFGGLAFGLAAIAYSLARVRLERRDPSYRIGTAPGVDQPVQGAPAASFPLVAPSERGDDFVLNIAQGMDGTLVVDGQSATFAQLVQSGHAKPSLATAGALELPIPPRAKIRASAGGATFLVSSVAKPRAQPTSLFAMESRAMTYFAGSLVAHLAILAILAQLPEDIGSASIDLGAQEDVTISARTSEHEDVPPPEDEKTGGLSGTDGEGKPAPMAEGAAGTTHSDRVDSHMRIKKTSDNPQMAREQAIEQARASGILGDTALTRGDAFAQLDSTANLSSGIDADNVYGAVFGAEGEGRGAFGYGRSGFEPGGGCLTPGNCGIIGSGRYGTIGFGKHAGDGWGGPGSGGPGGRVHKSTEPTTAMGQPTGSGDLDKSIIRRYIKRNLEKISYCYEHELLANPSLSGEITVGFFITPSGSVQAPVGKGFSPVVANCVADVIGRIEFPRPSNGGGVQVNYPFNFHAAGR
jgi:hypothetical protein